jgi:sulfonate transport system ATP-binding protein
MAADPSPSATFPAPRISGTPAAAEQNVIELREVRKAFAEREVLAGVDLTVATGEIVSLLGASGSGKTTLLRIVASLETATSGNLRVAQNRSVVFQEPRLLPFRKVSANVTLGLSKAQRRVADVNGALEEVGLQAHAKAWPSSLSGGEAQRVALARALIRAPSLMLLDEPFAALDALTRLRMQDLVLNLWARHRPGIILVTHDVDEAIALGDRVLVLRDGRISVDLALKTPRPRDRTSAEFGAVRRRLLSELGVPDPALDPAV